MHQPPPKGPVRLTRANGPKGHLLSTFNEPQNESAKPDSESEPASGIKAPEPGTDDDPISSSEDELTRDLDEPALPVFQQKKNSFQKNLEAPSSSASINIGWSSQSQGRSARKGQFKRTSSVITGGDEEEGDFLSSFSSWRPRNKRTKAKTYDTASPSYLKGPSSSAQSPAPTPAKRVQKPKKGKPNQAWDEDDFSSELSEPLELSDPEAKSETAMEVDNTSSEDEREDKEDSPGFIVPPMYAADSKSSFGTLSSKENQSTALDASPDISPSSPLSSAPSDIIGLLEEEAGMKAPGPRKWLCPMCKEEVDPDLLMMFEAQPKQRIREQQQFCASHKQNTAENEWQKHGYPEIQWDTFDQRIKSYFPELEKILAPGSNSYYHNILSATMKDGKAKNFRLTLAGDGIENISCGYYGTRGAGKMLQAVTERFSASLRRLSASDNIIKTAGVAGYAQSVLVPELTVCLVKDDMNVDEDAARQIIRESIDLGQKIHPALDDEVPVTVDEES